MEKKVKEAQDEGRRLVRPAKNTLLSLSPETEKSETDEEKSASDEENDERKNISDEVRT